MGKTNAHGTPSGFWRAVESYGRLGEGMTFPAFARFESLNAILLKKVDGAPYAYVNFPRYRHSSFDFSHFGFLAFIALKRR
jgi:hypothetical protein